MARGTRESATAVGSPLRTEIHHERPARTQVTIGGPIAQ